MSLKFDLSKDYSIVYGIAYPIEDQIPISEDANFEGFSSEELRDEAFLAWESDCFKAVLVIELPEKISHAQHEA